VQDNQQLLRLKQLRKLNGFIDIVAEIETDEIEQDNKRFASLFVPEKISVGLFAENQNDLTFVDLALQTAGDRKNIRLKERV
jgi:hypothetical protein